jgi:disulfide bond formation protein DsbB
MTDPDSQAASPSASSPVNDKSGTTLPDPDEVAKQAREHAWNWFALHATQRMQALNFFMVATAFLMAAYAALLEKHAIAAAVLALFGAWLAFLFNRLDDRSRRLVEAGEKALQPSQARLASLSANPDLKILDVVERPAAKPDGSFVSQRWHALKWSMSSYEGVIYWVQVTILAVFLFGFAYATWLAIRPSQGGGVVPAVPIERGVIPAAPISPERGVLPTAPIEFE